MAPAKNFLVGEAFFDQYFNRLGAETERVNSEPVLQLFVAGNLADDKLRSSLRNRRPRFSAVVSRERNRKHWNAERCHMLCDANARFGRIVSGEVDVLFGTVRGKNEFILIHGAAMNHDDGDSRDRYLC